MGAQWEVSERGGAAAPGRDIHRVARPRRLDTPHGGDVLVVILLYCLARTFLDVPIVPTALGALVFSFVIEGLQYLHFVERVGLGGNWLGTIVIGSSSAG